MTMQQVGYFPERELRTPAVVSVMPAVNLWRCGDCGRETTRLVSLPDSPLCLTCSRGSSFPVAPAPSRYRPIVPVSQFVKRQPVNAPRTSGASRLPQTVTRCCANPACSADISHLRPQASTCSPRCRKAVSRLAVR